VTSAAPVTVLDDLRRSERVPGYSGPSQQLEMGANGYPVDKKPVPAEPKDVADEAGKLSGAAKETAHLSSA